MKLTRPQRIAGTAALVLLPLAGAAAGVAATTHASPQSPTSGSSGRSGFAPDPNGYRYLRLVSLKLNESGDSLWMKGEPVPTLNGQQLSQLSAHDGEEVQVPYNEVSLGDAARVDRLEGMAYVTLDIKERDVFFDDTLPSFRTAIPLDQQGPVKVTTDAGTATFQIVTHET